MGSFVKKRFDVNSVIHRMKYAFCQFLLLDNMIGGTILKPLYRKAFTTPGRGNKDFGHTYNVKL